MLISQSVACLKTKTKLANVNLKLIKSKIRKSYETVTKQKQENCHKTGT